MFPDSRSSGRWRLPRPVVAIFLLTTQYLTAAYCACGQATLPPPALAKQVEIDLSNLELKGPLPFDAPFILVGTPSKKFTSIRLVAIREGSAVGRQVPIATAQWNRLPGRPLDPDAKGEKFGLMVASAQEYLRPNQLYVFVIEANEDAVLTEKEASVKQTFELQGYTESSLSDHVKLDFGAGYAFKPKALIGLTSVQFYFTPINENTDLAIDKLAPGRQLLVRMSVFAGLSPITFRETTDQAIKTRYKLGNFIYGVGIRAPFYGSYCNTRKFGRVFLQPMRLNVGVLNFAQDHQNPAITKDVNKQALFMSVTYDLNIAALLGPIGKILQ